MEVLFEHQKVSCQAPEVLKIEPLIIQPDRLAGVLQKLSRDDQPSSLLELQRLGVPKMVNHWLMTFANDSISERELVNAFVLHLLTQRDQATAAAGIMRLLRPRHYEVLNNPDLTVEERLVLHSLGAVAGPMTDQWVDMIGWDAVKAYAVTWN